jgi:hypothetical protein
MIYRYIVLFIALLPIAVSAHGDRPSLETETGGYLIDIGMDREGLRPHEEVTFDFDLMSAGDRPSFIPFESIDVLLTTESEVVLETSINNDDRYIPTLPVTFERSGEYALDVSYIQSGAVIAHTIFDLTVEPSAGVFARAGNMIYYVVAIFLIGFTIFAITRSYRSRA